MEAKTCLASGIERISGLEVVRPSELNILLYKSADGSVDINAVADFLGQRGWFVGRSREPQAVHLALNTVHHPIIDEYLLDLNNAVLEARSTGRVGTQDYTTY
jgi:glutamate/tyrosine decarboxylase-like PLP-dependent enzyme